jgi:hypothetical protein
MSTLYPFVRTQSGPAPAVLPAVLNVIGSIAATLTSPTAIVSGIVASGGAIVGSFAASVVAPTAAFSGTVSGAAGGVFLPGYLEYFGIFNQDYLTGETRQQFVSHL